MLDTRKIEEYLDANEHWRAKEYLQGRLSTLNYDKELYEAYGQVLLSMNDTLEAGKYLFLSGARNQEYAHAISLFVGRYSKDNIQHIFHSFPKSAQAANYSDYPAVVVSDLEKLGFEKNVIRTVTTNRGRSETIGEKITMGISVGVFFALVIGFVISGVKGLGSLWNWLVN